MKYKLELLTFGGGRIIGFDLKIVRWSVCATRMR